MKKAYNETWVENIENQDIVREWYEEKVLSQEQYTEARKLFPVEFYQPNIFIEFGLFIFTNLAISATFGFLGITFSVNPSLSVFSGTGSGEGKNSLSPPTWKT